MFYPTPHPPSHHTRCWETEAMDDNDNDDGIWKLGRYSLVLVALYNAGDFISRYFPLLYLWDSRKGLFIACLSRVLFIPCFYFAAKYAAAGWMFLLCLSLGTTNGYLSTCIFMVAPRGYNVREFHTILLLCTQEPLPLSCTAGVRGAIHEHSIDKLTQTKNPQIQHQIPHEKYTPKCHQIPHMPSSKQKKIKQ